MQASIISDSFYYNSASSAKEERPVWADRIRSRYNHLRNQYGKSYIDQLRIAVELGVSKGAVSHWMVGRRQPSNKEWDALARVLETTPEHLRYGVFPVHYNNQNNIDPTSGFVLSSHKDLVSRLDNFEMYAVPVLDWNQAKEGIKAVDMYAQDCTNIVYFTKKVKKTAFGLSLTVNTMISSSSGVRGFYPGEKIIVDPEATPYHEECVIAYANHLPSPILRQWNDENGIITLKAFDVREKTIDFTPEWKILGVVVGSVWEK
jgi:SOS-response transcriptional repressor LexA